ncbi:tyrosine protein kinase [Pelomyxa schiedti]|nr:tyrosine protein kinase [Pelomyxa schiedti]
MYLFFNLLEDCSKIANQSVCNLTSVCSWCESREICIAGKQACQECSASDNQASCISMYPFRGCSYCPSSETCVAGSCGDCFQKDQGTCLTPDCRWCNATAMCVGQSDYCSFCTDVRDNEQYCQISDTPSCKFCSNSICVSSTQIDCPAACSTYIDQRQCDTMIGCRWCTSQNSCLISSLSCDACDNLDETGCLDYSGCQWNQAGAKCSDFCPQVLPEMDFISSFVKPSASKNGSLVKTREDLHGNLYSCGNSDGPFFVKFDSVGTEQCYFSWDKATGVVNSLEIDEDSSLMYLVGSGEYTPLKLENAPNGLLVSMSFLTQDAFIMALNMSDCDVSWSVPWGGPGDESFQDIISFSEYWIILVSSPEGTFPLPKGQYDGDCAGDKSCLLFFDKSWTLQYCYGLGQSQPSRITAHGNSNFIFEAQGHFLATLSEDCTTTQCEIVEDQWHCTSFSMYWQASQMQKCFSPALFRDSNSMLFMFFVHSNSLFRASWGSYEASLSLDFEETLYDLAQYSYKGLAFVGTNPNASAVIGFFSVSSMEAHSISMQLTNETGCYSSLWVGADGSLVVSGNSNSYNFMSTSNVQYLGGSQNLYNPVMGKFSVAPDGIPCLQQFPTPIYWQNGTFARTHEAHILWPSIFVQWDDVQFGIACLNSSDLECSHYELWYWSSSTQTWTEVRGNTNSVTLVFAFEYHISVLYYIRACNMKKCVETGVLSINGTIDPVLWDESMDLCEPELGAGLELLSNGEFTREDPFSGTGFWRLQCWSSCTLDIQPDLFVLQASLSWITLVVRTNSSESVAIDISLIDAFGLAFTVSLDESLHSQWRSICINTDDSSIDKSSIQKIQVSFSFSHFGAYSIDVDRISAASTDVFCHQASLPLWSYIVIAVGSALFAAVSAVATVIFWRKIHSKKNEGGVELSAVDKLQFFSQPVDPSEILDTSLSKEVSLADLGLTLSVETFTFGLESHQASVGSDNVEHFTISNSSHNKLALKFFLPHTPKFSVSMSPIVTTLSAGKNAEFTAILRCHCTTKISSPVYLAVTRGNTFRQEESCFCIIPISVESRVSTKLDPEELILQRPPIGEGSYGSVFQGSWRNGEVAVKVLKIQSGTGVYEDFQREVEMLESLRNIYIVNFVGAVHLSGALAIVTEYMPLGNLWSCMQKHTFSQALKLKCLLDAAKGILFLHTSSILHRDLKPDNFLMASLQIDAPVNCKLTDFGTCRDVHSNSSKLMTTGIGTPAYMSPELLDNRAYTSSADVYSFAIVMYQILKNTEPYNATEFSSTWRITEFVIAGKRLPIPEEWDPRLRTLIASCWAAEADARPDFKEISEVLESLQNN